MIGFVIGVLFGTFCCYAQYRAGNKLFLYVDKLTKKQEAPTQ